MILLIQTNMDSGQGFPVRRSWYFLLMKSLKLWTPTTKWISCCLISPKPLTQLLITNFYLNWHIMVYNPIHINAWIATWLTTRTQKVIVEGERSKDKRVLSGVLQGTVLGSLMFLLYINDIDTNICSSIRLFADDCIPM